MRASHMFVGFVTVGLLACGGGEHHVIVDANTIDAPPDAFICDFDAVTTGTLTLAGTGGAPLPFAGTYTTSTPPKLAFALNGILSDTAPQKDLFMIWIDEVGMFATGAAAGRFTGPPATGATGPSINTDDLCGGCVDGFTGYTNGASGNPDPSTATQVYQVDMAAPGTLQFDTWSAAVTVGAPINIKGSYNNISFIGFDPVSTDANGCLATFAKLAFNFTITWPAPTFTGARKYKKVGEYEVDVTDIPTATFHHD